VDPGMAPPGKHVMSCFVQWAPYHLADDAVWDDAARDTFGETVIDTIEERFPDIRNVILHRQVLTPKDIEDVTGLTEGNIFQGELSLEQLFFNGLVPAAYLAKAGRRVLVLERRDRAGGILETLEVAPGVRAPGIAHTVGRLRRSVIEDLGLERHGLVLVDPPVRVFAPQPDGSALTLWADPARTAEELRARSPHDADAYPRFDA